MTGAIGFALVCAVCGYFLEALGWRGARLFLVLSAAMLLGAALNYAQDTLSEFFGIMSVGDFSDIGKTVIKIIGIGYITGITADICTDLGAVGVAGGITLLGRIETLAVVAPYFVEILKAGEEFLR